MLSVMDISNAELIFLSHSALSREIAWRVLVHVKFIPQGEVFP